MLLDADGHFDPAKAKRAFRDGRGIGQVGRPSDAGKGQNARGMADLNNAIQKFLIENTHLGHHVTRRGGPERPEPLA
jgi:beta-glucosidase